MSLTFSFALLRLSFLRAPPSSLVAATPGRRRPQQCQTGGKLPLHVDAQAGAWGKASWSREHVCAAPLGDLTLHRRP